MVCGIGAANAELPENVKFCIPKQYTITYDCGQLGGTVPDSVTVGYGHNFTTAASAYCGGARWRVNDTDTIITPGTTLPYTYTNNITLHAVPWCNPGMWPDGNKCVDCGYGHYCMGGDHRAVCSGGIVGCNSTRNTTDHGIDERMANRTLTLDEVNNYVPESDMSQWELVSSCLDETLITKQSLIMPEVTDICNTAQTLPHVKDTTGCNYEPLSPGTYLFTNYLSVGSFCKNGAAWSNIAVFTHPVSYKIIHVCNIWNIFLDTNHSEFTKYNIKLPQSSVGSNGDYCLRQNISNVNDASTAGAGGLRVYRLR
ncbi:MAG: hypothetical protein IJ560_04320 [Alphaproteobacteria bacterium]|nr:hypothetical protein [Alphaproteobacteria bacterium]